MLLQMEAKAAKVVSEDTLETIKRGQVEQKSVLKFSNKSSVRKSTTRFQCAQKHASRASGTLEIWKKSWFWQSSLMRPEISLSPCSTSNMS